MKSMLLNFRFYVQSGSFCLCGSNILWIFGNLFLKKFVCFCRDDFTLFITILVFAFLSFYDCGYYLVVRYYYMT